MDKSAQAWKLACESFPGRALPLSFAKGEKPQDLRPVVINPGSIPALTRFFHFADGRTSPDTPGGLTFAESLELLLHISNPQRNHTKLLAITYQRLGNLLARIASIQYRQPSEIYKIKTSEKWTCLRAQSLFAILLTSLNHPYEKTMNSPAYQIGQLCASFDTLHAAYCYVERGGKLPPRLIGNSCFQASNRNPIAALGQLSSRAAPYFARLYSFRDGIADQFIEKNKSDKNATDVIWSFLKIRNHLPYAAQKLAASLDANPQPVDDLFRCQLLLGYLSGPLKFENSSATQSNSTHINS